MNTLEAAALDRLKAYRIDAPAVVPSDLITAGPVVPYEVDGTGSRQAFTVETAHCRVVLHRPHVRYLSVQGWQVWCHIRTRSSIWNAATNPAIADDARPEFEWESALVTGFPEWLVNFKTEGDEHAEVKARAILRRLVLHVRRIKAAGLALWLECAGDTDCHITADALAAAEGQPDAPADQPQAEPVADPAPAAQPARLLIVACSDTKRQVQGPVPAAELYDGPAYRVMRNSRPADIVLILSAEHGLLPADAPISTYNRRMDKQRAVHFMTDPGALAAAYATIAHATAGREITEICCFGGKDYACVVRDYARTGLLPAPVAWDSRGIGHKLGTLKTWLEAPA